jgi:hypothetical protein
MLMKPKSNPALCATSMESPINSSKFGSPFVESRLVRKERGGKPVDRFGGGRHVAIGIEIAVKSFTGRHPVDHLDAADFDQPVATARIESGGFRIEDDFTHYMSDMGLLGGSDKGRNPLFCGARGDDRMDEALHRVAGFGQRGAGVDDMVGKLALFRVGHLQREDPLRNFSSLIPGRASTRSRCIAAGAETTTTASSPC